MNNSMLRKLGFSFALLVAFSPLASAAFSDVASDHENYEAIIFAQNQGIVQGYGDGTFKPDNLINRAEFTKIIVESLFSATEIASCNYDGSFSDVPSTEWYVTHLCIAKDNGIIQGYGDGTFKPNQNINAAEAVKMIAVAYGAQGDPGKDPWYTDYVIFMMSEGRNAIPNSLEEPEQLIDRGEMVEMIYRLETFK
jgi:hypothetical protein